MRPADIALRIEEMVIEGASRPEAERIARATRRGLERLLAERSLPAEVIDGAAHLRPSPPPLEIAPSANPERTGSRIATAVHGAIRR